MWTVIQEEIHAIDRSPKALRSFGTSVGPVLLLIGIVVLWQNEWHPSVTFYVLVSIGGALILLGLVRPAVLKPLHIVWMGLALLLGFIMTRVVLTVVFYLAVTPIGVVLRALDKDPLQRTVDKEAETYWVPKVYDDPSPSRLEKYY